MSEEPEQPPARTFRGVVLGGLLLAAILVGAVVVATVSPRKQPSARQQARPIVQIVRQQSGLPDLSDLIDRLCPSIAVIVPQGANLPGLDGATAIHASQYSADGWLVTSATGLPQGPLDAVFGDGQRVGLTDMRTDSVSGLAIMKAAGSTASALPFSDQAFPRVGQFGVGLTTPAGTGCSATSAMIGSDFLADGGGLLGYVRLSPPPGDWGAGIPLLGNDGRVLGIGTEDPAGAIIPAPIASVILDELIRGSLSPSTNFGFRVVDYAAPFATRLGNVRSGAGIALVRPKSIVAKSGLRAGDIVTAVDDLPVSSASELGRALDAVPVKAILTVQRGSQQLTVPIRRVGSHGPA